MAQLTSGSVSLATFNDMRTRYNNYVSKNHSLPSKIYTVLGGSNYVSLPYFDVMVGNKDRYVKAYGSQPLTIGITNVVKTFKPIVKPPIEQVDELGYYINRVNTPLQNISWTGLKSKGINAVYIRCAEENLDAISTYLPAIKAAGLKPYAWTWNGFTMFKEAVAKGWNICHDLEVYNMASYYDKIKAIQTICKAGSKTFILCTKAEAWDGDQKWGIIKDYCDYLSPMLYLGDYNKTIVQLEAYMKLYNTKYPNKIYPSLETYKSDANPVKKDLAVLRAEIAACEPYCKGIGLFRYGLSPL